MGILLAAELVAEGAGWAWGTPTLNCPTTQHDAARMHSSSTHPSRHASLDATPLMQQHPFCPCCLLCSGGKELVRDGRPSDAYPIIEQGLQLALETADLRAERALMRVRARALRDAGEAAPHLAAVAADGAGCGWVCFRACLPACARACLPACLSVCLHVHLPARPPACLPPVQVTLPARCVTCSAASRCRSSWGRGVAMPTPLVNWAISSQARPLPFVP